MKAFEFELWQPSYYEGKFTNNIQRFVIVHARNEDEARQLIPLRKGKEYPLHTTKDESVYDVKDLGSVRIEKFYVYQKDKSPISVKEFKKRMDALVKDGKPKARY